MIINILRVNYSNKQHATDMAQLLEHYANDPMGGGKSLANGIADNLAVKLACLPHAFSILAYVNDKPVGLINCFETFSTFQGKPLVNIHDVIVHQDYRGQGLSHKMLAEVERIAIEKGCCKLTLEVLAGNEIAKSSYNKFGFSGYELDPKTGQALFWQKTLP